MRRRILQRQLLEDLEEEGLPWVGINTGERFTFQVPSSSYDFYTEYEVTQGDVFCAFIGEGVEAYRVEIAEENFPKEKVTLQMVTIPIRFQKNIPREEIEERANRLFKGIESINRYSAYVFDAGNNLIVRVESKWSYEEGKKESQKRTELRRIYERAKESAELYKQAF